MLFCRILGVSTVFNEEFVMATSATKKPSTRATKKAPAKKASAKRVAAAKTTHHRTVVRTTKAARSADMRSFRASPSTEPFFTFRITHQTLYWLILAVIVVCLAAWVMSISIKLERIYDQIDATNHETFNLQNIKPAHKAE